jgi:hypothetical protein
MTLQKMLSWRRVGARKLHITVRFSFATPRLFDTNAVSTSADLQQTAWLLLPAAASFLYNL